MVYCDWEFGESGGIINKLNLGNLVMVLDGHSGKAMNLEGADLGGYDQLAEETPTTASTPPEVREDIGDHSLPTISSPENVDGPKGTSPEVLAWAAEVDAKREPDSAIVAGLGAVLEVVGTDMESADEDPAIGEEIVGGLADPDLDLPTETVASTGGDREILYNRVRHFAPNVDKFPYAATLHGAMDDGLSLGAMREQHPDAMEWYDAQNWG